MANVFKMALPGPRKSRVEWSKMLKATANAAKLGKLEGQKYIFLVEIHENLNVVQFLSEI